MKAYIAHDRVNYDNYGVETIVFAETPSKAKKIAMCTEACEDADYTDIRVRRLPGADKLYKGKSEVDWYDKNERLVLVRDFGWACSWTDSYCDDCPAKQWCRHWEDEEGDEDA